MLSYFFSCLYEMQGSWVRKKTEWCSHAVYIRKASPGIRTGSRLPGAAASSRATPQTFQRVRKFTQALKPPGNNLRLLLVRVAQSDKQPLPKNKMVTRRCPLNGGTSRQICLHSANLHPRRLNVVTNAFNKANPTCSLPLAPQGGPAPTLPAVICSLLLRLCR